MMLQDNLGTVLRLITGSRRWRKSSKCKSLIKRLKSSLAYRMSRGTAMVQQSRSDISQLIQKGEHQLALAKIEYLYRDQCKLSAYGQLEALCGCILNNLCDVFRHSKQCYEVVEAVSSLIFAASRCGELHELHAIRTLFRDHFGQDFERKNVQLLPGNAVNSRLTCMLNVRVSLAQELKLQLLEDIKKQHQLQTVNLYSEQTFLTEINTEIRVDYHHSTTNSTTSTCYRITNEKTDYGVINHAAEWNRKAECLHRDEAWNMKSPSHVHPKLPDYDELVTQFTNLKKHVRESSNH